MGFLRFCRRVFVMLRVEHPRAELLVMHRLVRSFDAVFEGHEVGKLAKPPPDPAPLLPPTPLARLRLL